MSVAIIFIGFPLFCSRYQKYTFYKHHNFILLINLVELEPYFICTPKIGHIQFTINYDQGTKSNNFQMRWLFIFFICLISISSLNKRIFFIKVIFGKNKNLTTFNNHKDWTWGEEFDTQFVYLAHVMLCSACDNKLFTHLLNSNYRYLLLI